MRLKVLLALLFSLPAFAMQSAQGDCSTGNQKVTTQGLQSSTLVMRSFPSCTITVYITGTATLATLYSDNNSTPLANPFTANSTGHWIFFSTNGVYDVVRSGAGFPAPSTLSSIPIFDPTIANIVAADSYGCKGNGTTDDTTCIANAIASFGANGGILTFTCGKTYLATSIDVHDTANISLQGCATASRYSKFSPTTTATATLLYSGTGSVFINADSTTGFSIRNLRIIYNNAGFSGTLIRQIHSASGADAGHNTYENNHFAGTASASTGKILDVGFNGAGPTVIRQNEFLYFQIGILGLVDGSVGYSNVVAIEDNEFALYNAPGGCSIQNPGDGWLISGNTFEAGTDGHPCGLVSPTAGTGLSPSRGLTYIGNWHGDATILGSNAWVTVYGSGIIAGNHFESAAAIANGLGVCAVGSLSIDGNNFGHPSAGLAAGVIFTGGAGCTAGTVSMNGNNFTYSTTPVTNSGGPSILSALGNLNFANRITSNIVLTVATGTAPLTVTSTTPVAHLTAVMNCGTTSGTQQVDCVNVSGAATIGAGGNVTQTFTAPYTFPANDFQCAANDTNSTPGAVGVGATTSTSVIFYGTVGHTVRFLCWGR